MGLAQVYGIVRQHEGHIGVQTKMGHGATFQVYLPAYQAEEKKDMEQTTALIAPAGRGETILLVEDNDRIREAGHRILESLGYQVLTAANGREALHLYRSTGEVDLVITDVVMPEMGGKELIQELQKEAPHLKALVTTGHMLAEDRQELKAQGILNTIRKPFDVNTLADTIRRALDED